MEPNSKLSIRLLANSDSQNLWLWRNDPMTIENSLSGLPVTQIEHEQWFNTVRTSKSRVIYIGETDNVPFGMVRFDIRDKSESAYVSINLAPEARGLRLAQPLLRAAITRFHQYWEIPLIADIKPKNVKSIKTFTGCGFVQIYSSQDVLQFEFKREL